MRFHNLTRQEYEFLNLMRATAHPGMQSEPLRIGAQDCSGFLVPAEQGSQAACSRKQATGVTAGRAGDWRWSSCRASMGQGL